MTDEKAPLHLQATHIAIAPASPALRSILYVETVEKVKVFIYLSPQTEAELKIEAKESLR